MYANFLCTVPKMFSHFQWKWMNVWVVVTCRSVLLYVAGYKYILTLNKSVTSSGNISYTQRSSDFSISALLPLVLVLLLFRYELVDHHVIWTDTLPYKSVNALHNIGNTFKNVYMQSYRHTSITAQKHINTAEIDGSQCSIALSVNKPWIVEVVLLGQWGWYYINLWISLFCVIQFFCFVVQSGQFLFTVSI